MHHSMCLKKSIEKEITINTEQNKNIMFFLKTYDTPINRVLTMLMELGMSW